MVKPEAPREDEDVVASVCTCGAKPAGAVAAPPTTAVVPPQTPALMREDPNDPNSSLRWKHRRRLAYMAMFGMLFVTAYMMGPRMPIERINVLSDMIGWFYFAMASIVGAYMGFATWSAKLTR